jgi:hypothetical protein
MKHDGAALCGNGHGVGKTLTHKRLWLTAFSWPSDNWTRDSACSGFFDANVGGAVDEFVEFR